MMIISMVAGVYVCLLAWLARDWMNAEEGEC